MKLVVEFCRKTNTSVIDRVFTTDKFETSEECREHYQKDATVNFWFTVKVYSLDDWFLIMKDLY